MNFVIPLPVIDPVALNLGPLSVKWYGLAYMAGLLLGWWYARRITAENRLWGGQSPIKPDHFDDLLLWVTLGVVVGGRLGEVLFYNPGYYFSHPSQIFATWKGGMSFHGGFLGSVLVSWWFARRNKLPLLSVWDVLAAVAPIGLFFGRVANFINGELWGHPTDVPWGMIFPSPEAGNVARHPSQLYEAALEGIVLFLVLRWLTHHRQALLRPGLVAGAMAAGYGLARIFVEIFREPEPGLGLMIGFITPGMIYSMPMVLVGAWLVFRALTGPATRIAGAKAR